MTPDNLITITIPSFRRPSLLSQALMSCIAQDYRPLEIDIGDDSPTNDSELVANAIVLPDGVTLRYRRNTPGLGQAGNVNALFGAARGKRLVLLHDDDVLLPGAIRALDEAWQVSADIVAAYGIQQVIQENGELSQRDTDIHNGHANRISGETGLQRDIVVRALWRQFPNNGYLIETAAARTVGYRSFEEVGDPCDADFGVRLALLFRGRTFAFIDRLTSQYRLSLHGLRNSTNVSWKFFDELQALGDLTPSEDCARQGLLHKIAAQATVENAIHGRRQHALGIYFSQFYPRDHGPVKSIYHLATIAIPRLAGLRRALSHA